MTLVHELHFEYFYTEKTASDEDIFIQMRLFSEISDGEILCKMYLAKESIDTIVSTEPEQSKCDSESSDNIPIFLLKKNIVNYGYKLF